MISDDVKALEAELTAEKTKRREALAVLDEVKFILSEYSRSTCKAWGRTLDKIGAQVGVKVDHGR